jgi:hypothetical protein
VGLALRGGFYNIPRQNTNTSTIIESTPIFGWFQHVYHEHFHSYSHKSNALSRLPILAISCILSQLYYCQNLHLDKSYFFTIIAGISESPPHKSSALRSGRRTRRTESTA